MVVSPGASASCGGGGISVVSHPSTAASPPCPTPTPRGPCHCVPSADTPSPQAPGTASRRWTFASRTSPTPGARGRGWCSRGCTESRGAGSGRRRCRWAGPRPGTCSSPTRAGGTAGATAAPSACSSAPTLGQCCPAGGERSAASPGPGGARRGPTAWGRGCTGIPASPDVSPAGARCPSPGHASPYRHLPILPCSGSRALRLWEPPEPGAPLELGKPLGSLGHSGAEGAVGDGEPLKAEESPGAGKHLGR